MAGKLHIPVDLREDFFHDAGIPALMRAAAKYDSTKGFKFSTYACSCIFNAFLTWKTRKKHDTVNDNAMEYNDDLHRACDETPSFEYLDLLGVLLKSLTERERAIITLRHADGWTLEQIGGVLGMSKELTRQHILNALKKARAAYEVSHLSTERM
jgi:RNA polymerase sigma factor (sigma-70 family)